MSDKITDKLVGGGVKPELSPNPNGSGYTKQVEVDALSSVVNPEGNVLYICQGRKYKYLEQAIIDPATNKVLVPSGFVRVDNGPLVHLVKGERGTPVHENVAPQVQPRVFNEPVALNGGVTIKGKTIEDYIDSEGVVTEEELRAFVKANPTLAGTESNLSGIEIDGVKYGVGGSSGSSKMYLHAIHFTKTYTFYVSIINASQTPLTFESLYNLLKDSYYIRLGAYGSLINNQSQKCLAMSIFVYPNYTDKIWCECHDASNNTYDSSLEETNFMQDIVVEL